MNIPFINSFPAIPRKPLCLLAFLLASGAWQLTPLIADETDDVYQLGPDSAAQEGVPRGKVIGPLTLASEVFPNTTRHYWVYVPGQYDGSQPARLMIFQDGQGH